MKKIFLKTGLILSMTLPLVTFAQSTKAPAAFAGDNTCVPYTLACLVGKVISYIQLGIYLIIAFAVVTFVWNVYRYFFTEKDKAEAGMYVLYSTIGFFVILSFWGLVNIMSNTLKLPTEQPGWPFGGSSSQSTQRSISGPTTNQ